MGEVNGSSPFNKNPLISQDDLIKQADIIPSLSLEALQEMEALFRNVSPFPPELSPFPPEYTRVLKFNVQEEISGLPVLNFNEISPEEAAAANPENLAVMNEKQDRIDLSNSVQEKIQNRPYVVKYNGQVRDNIAINFVDSKRFVLLVRIAVINFILRSILQKKSQLDKEEERRSEEDLAAERRKELEKSARKDVELALDKQQNTEQQNPFKPERATATEREEKAAAADRMDAHIALKEADLKDKQERTDKQKVQTHEQDKDDVLQRAQHDRVSNDEEGIT